MGSLAIEEEPTCWVTLVTKPSYLAGVIILSHTLDQHSSKYQLVVQYTDSLGAEAITTLEDEAARTGRMIPNHVELLLPRPGQENHAGVAVAERFRDVFTKLRAFEVYKLGFTRACLLDADIAAFKNPDSVFDIDMPRDWIGAIHPCMCIPDSDGAGWASAIWQKGNCAYTTLTAPDQICTDVSSRPTYTLVNGGVIVFYPTQELWVSMMGFFNYSERLKDYQFPDQEFFADFFQTRWKPLSWKYNALKTFPYIHPALWSKGDVIFLHYIIDKPWDRRVSPQGIGGHKGRDGERHLWWEAAYESWVKTQKPASKSLEIVNKLVFTQEPVTEKVPLTFVPGRLEDIKPYDELMGWPNSLK